MSRRGQLQAVKSDTSGSGSHCQAGGSCWAARRGGEGWGVWRGGQGTGEEKLGRGCCGHSWNAAGEAARHCETGVRHYRLTC